MEKTKENNTSSLHRAWSYLLISACMCLAYVALAQLGLSLATLNKTASPVWPASGLAIGLLGTLGRRFWPAIAAAAYIANLLTGQAPELVVLVAAGNTLEALIGSSLIIFLLGKITTGTHRITIAVLVAAVVGGIVSATIGTLALFTYGNSPLESVPTIWLTWWTGHSLGVVIVTPLFILLQKKSRNPIQSGLWKLVPLVAIGSLLLWILFFKSTAAISLFLCFPLLLIGAFVAGGVGVQTLALIISCVGVWSTYTGIGLFHFGSLNTNLIHLQLFLGSIGITALVLADFHKVVSLKKPAIVLLSGWTLASLVFHSFYGRNVESIEKKFESTADKAEHALAVKLDEYFLALRSGIGLYAASDNVTNEEWTAFVTELGIDKNLPGLLGMGVVNNVKQVDFLNFMTSARKNISNTFVYRTLTSGTSQVAGGIDGKAEEAYIITYIVPLERNRNAVGLDVSTEPRRKAAAIQSRDSGLPRLTESIPLVQDSKGRAAFLAFNPFYQKGKKLSTVAERRSHHLGWIFAPIIIEEFFGAALNNDYFSDLDYSVFETEAIISVAQSIGFSVNSSRLSLDRKIEVGGRRFIIKMKPSKNFSAEIDTSSSWAGSAAALLCLLVGALAVSQQTLQERATAIATEKTSELRELNRSLTANREKLDDALKDAKIAVQSKSDFLSTMSHEIRTPLNAVIGMTNLVLSTDLTTEQRDYLGNVVLAGDSLLGIVNDVLDFSKIDAGKLTLELLDFNIAELTHECERVLSYAIKKNNIAFSIENHSTLPSLIRGDSGRVRQVLFNLLSNAIKFSENGKIVCRTRILNASADKVAIKFEIEDNGIGISELAQKNLFQVFTQADQSTTRRFGGTGLGLSISKKLVELMGGRIGVSSEVGVGSIFWFELEFETVVSQPALNSKTLSNASSTIANSEELSADKVVKGLLLLVEDNPINQKIASIWLRKQGHQVDTVANGIEALNAIRHIQYDLILMDCQMPEMDGYETTKCIRTEKDYVRSAQIPIIAMTANASPEDRQRCVEAGMNDYVSKPINFKLLSDSIERSLQTPESGQKS